MKTLLLTLLALSSAAPIGAAGAGKPLTVPLGEKNLHLDDYYFDENLKKLVVPGGRTGKLLLIDPETRAVESLEVVPVSKDAPETASGLTTAHGGEGLIFTANRTDNRLYVMDPAIKKVIAKAQLASAPDIVRYVSATREVWVTEPKKNQIEVFSLSASTALRPIDPRQELIIPSTHGEYEFLQIDMKRKRAYSNQEDTTVAIELQSKKIVETWKNGCKSATGLALDAERGFLIVACREGRATVLDLKDGRQLSSLKSGDGVDLIAYVPSRSLVYLPGAKSQTLAWAELSPAGELKAAGKPAATVKNAHCVAADPLGGAWVCDGASGALLYFPPPEE